MRAAGTALGSAALVAANRAFAGPAIQRPITDFLDAQGTTSIFFPPVPDQIGWASAAADPPVLIALVDYAGLAAEFLAGLEDPLILGTTMTGHVLDRPLADGRSEVTVVLRTTNALTFVLLADDDTDFTNNPVLFGYKPSELAADPTLTPALSQSHLKVVFTNTAPGADLPDLVDAFILGNAADGQELRSLAFRANGSGPLREAFGVPEGTPGRSVVSQTGLLTTGFHGAVADAFPVELVKLHVVGG
ncbi:hypothetical protein OV090_40670 [Nannocystis sp. RBIL2]|uniref:hypothetical protein n=1 Tax=Nannocystis sp. RBIL2 TaxID=2996788 RepID=UPI00226DB0AD|nr:hypothetical protein [Nannocystis sp. RBIL2]MCY1071127.1 hypothetical protein [Nannocystis sp. RBIL2]